MPVVSVLMASYNHATCVGEAITSVLDQSFGDLELIVVDDCSTDHTWEVVQQYAQQDSRVTVIRREVNGGPPAAYNRALAEASGEIIMSLDSDDLFLPDKIEEQVDFLARHPEVGVLATYIRALPPNPAAEEWFNQPRDLNDPAIWIWTNPLAHSSTAVTRWAHDRIGRADEQAILLSDWDKYLRAQACGVPLAILPRRLTGIHISPKTLTHSDPPRTAVEYLRMGADYWHRYLRDSGRSDLVSADLSRMLEQLAILGDAATPELSSLAARAIDSSPEGGSAAASFAQRQATKRADYDAALTAQKTMIDERTGLLRATEDTLEREREVFRWEIAGRDQRLQTLSQEIQQLQGRLQRLEIIEVSPKAQIKALRSSVPASLKKRGRQR